MIIVFGIITAVYLIFISILYFAYQKVKSFKLSSIDDIHSFSVIIPFRNEAKNLETLLHSINEMKYAKSQFEIILVDDESEDNSVEIIKTFINLNQDNALNISIIKNNRQSNSPKKDAIQTAVLKAKYDWIITTDADCVVPKTWLVCFNQFIMATSPKLIVAPVTYSVTNKLLDVFQLHDFLSLQTATVSGFGIHNPFLCNGANLCYSKSIFTKLNGFEGNTNIASGDDVFFMEKVLQNYPNDVHFIKSVSAAVITQPKLTLNALFNQRVRWASKTSASHNLFNKILALAVFAMNATLVICLVFTLLNLASWQLLSSLFIVKFCIDFLFIFRSTNFFNQNTSLKYYPLNSLLYPFFIVGVSSFSMFFNYKWKGRSFKK